MHYTLLAMLCSFLMSSAFARDNRDNSPAAIQLACLFTTISAAREFISYPDNGPTDTAQHKGKAKWAKWLGIGACIGLIIPGVNLFSLPAAIASLIIGGQVRRHSNDKNNLSDVDRGKIGAIITIGFLFVITAITLLVVYLGNHPG